MQNKLICGDNLNHTQHQLLDAKLFVTTVINQLKSGSLDSENAVNEICLYMADVKGHILASFLRQIVVIKMDGITFERFIALMFTLRGYIVQFTPRTGDKGVDLIAARNGERIAIQCKRWKDSVGTAAVQQVFTGKEFYKCTKGILITTASLSPQAERLANKIDITYWDKDSIEILCEECVRKWDVATDIIQRVNAKSMQLVGVERISRTVWTIINSSPRGVGRTNLLRRCWRIANAKELTGAVDMLVQNRRVRIKVIKSKTKGRPRIIYIPYS